MTTLEIPRPEWSTFLHRMTRLHVGEPIRLEVLRLDVGAQLAMNGLALVGITASGRGDDDWIEIAAGTSPDGHAAHRIAGPVRMHVLRRILDDDEVLEIRSADHTTTLLHFDAPSSWRESNQRKNP
jgi:hypothetical protein